MKTSHILFYTSIAAPTACKVQIETPVEGDVTTTSTAIECAAGQVCSVDVSDIFFEETFVADPAPGWHFAGWKKRPSGLCGGSATPCAISTSGFDGYPGLEAVLADSLVITYLEPEFVVERTTEGITIAGEQNQTAFGLDFDFDFYRNNTYSCGLSGNYTFMVVNPANGGETVEAPLWVFLHGGGAGFYDENGDYQAVGNQTEDTWNREETFDDFLIKQLQGRTLENGQLTGLTPAASEISRRLRIIGPHRWIKHLRPRLHFFLIPPACYFYL